MSHSGNAYIDHLNNLRPSIMNDAMRDFLTAHPLPIVAKPALVKSEWKNLGCVNGWHSNPKEYDACKAQGHKLIETNLGRCWNRWECPICKIYFDVDSSD